MKITDQRLEDVEYAENRNRGGGLDGPRFIVIHYTADAGEPGGMRGSLEAIRSRGLSAHLFAGRDGELVQTVPFDRVAYHAGESRWAGYSSLNRYGIGIENANAGWLVPQSDGTYRRPPRWGSTRKFNEEEVVVASHPNGWPRDYGWELYPEAQLEAVREVCVTLLETYPTIVDIVGHDMISPERKQDPGPAFPIERFRQLVEARNARRHDGDVLYETTARDGLNLRPRTGTDNTPLRTLPLGTRLRVLEEQGDWRLVDLEGDGLADGFVHRSYLRPV